MILLQSKNVGKNFGGLKALQIIIVITAFPLLIILCLMGFALFKALRIDYRKLTSIQAHRTVMQYQQVDVTWQKRLACLLSYPNRESSSQFISKVVVPAMQKVGQQIQSYGIECHTKYASNTATLHVIKDGFNDFIYTVRLNRSAVPDYVESDTSDNYYRAEVLLNNAGQPYDISGYTEQQIIIDMISHYEKHLHSLHLIDD